VLICNGVGREGRGRRGMRRRLEVGKIKKWRKKEERIASEVTTVWSYRNSIIIII